MHSTKIRSFILNIKSLARDGEPGLVFGKILSGWQGLMHLLVNAERAARLESEISMEREMRDSNQMRT